MSKIAEFENILLEREGDGVASLTLNRPAKLNSFTVAMAEEVQAAWAILREDEDTRAIVLRAAEGRAFCSGVDVTELWPEKEGRPFDYQDPGEFLGPKSNRVWKPVVAAIHGIAAGGAFYFLNECDILICSEEAQFFDPHVSYGLVAAVEPIGALRHMPYQEVMRMALMGNEERICARTALRISLVTEIVSREGLWDRAAEIAGRLASKPAVSIQGTVRAIWLHGNFLHGPSVSGSLQYTQLGNPLGLAEIGNRAIAKVPWVER